ncbi:hypothetical protein PISMIDRAFT_679209 [Pisolithus microcarpus 441]|uniref:Secreted protein n=1 Tax=Pisolithus microcarpus 441 TaxID=765257 RepID=A0A0C9ZV54_9AGAM|nr:hypothetical protein PISMIDRAFT_679209 [Pisolithus microcarpus 441]
MACRAVAHAHAIQILLILARTSCSTTENVVDGDVNARSQNPKSKVRRGNGQEIGRQRGRMYTI